MHAVYAQTLVVLEQGFYLLLQQREEKTRGNQLTN